MPGSTVLVIGGATGFIGKAVTAELAKDPDHVVFAAGRRSSSSLAIPYRHCDLTDPSSLASAFEGIDVVINCFREQDGEEAAWQATSNLLAACRKSRVKRLIYLSSVAVYGNARGTVTESTPPQGPLSWYANSKLRAERACEDAASAIFTVAVVRPSLVYGPGGEEWSEPFIRSVRASRLGDLGPPGDGTANLIFVGDLARLCVFLVKDGGGHFGIYNANHPVPVTFNDYFREIAGALGLQGCQCVTAPKLAVFRKLTRGVLRSVAPALEAVGAGAVVRRLSAVAAARPEDGIPKSYSAQVYYSPTLILSRGFVFQTSLTEGVRRSCAATVNRQLEQNFCPNRFESWSTS